MGIDGALRLEVGRSARVPDSEAVSERLSLLATTAGIPSFEFTEHTETKKTDWLQG
jgi:hypothetical protein